MRLWWYKSRRIREYPAAAFPAIVSFYSAEAGLGAAIQKVIKSITKHHHRKEKHMKKLTHSNLFSSCCLALVLLLVHADLSLAVDDNSQTTVTTEAQNKAETDMMARCQAMMTEKQKIRAEIKAQDAELKAQVAKMNSAPQDEKLDLLAAVVTQMVEQRIAMQDRKARMEEQMMPHMMQHMKMGMGSMTHCPMMQDMDKKSEDAP